MKIQVFFFIKIFLILKIFIKKERNVRALIESQFLSMYIHSKNIGLFPSRIFATGGASKNKSILTIMSNIFGIPIYTHSQPNSACLGAAYRFYFLVYFLL